MPRLLDDREVDQVADEVDAALTMEEERAEMARFAPQAGAVPDLTDGGMVGGAKLTPRQNGRPTERGRPAARRGWTWNGTETTLTLAWNPDGTAHDGARRHLTKRVCLCCKFAGFRKMPCPVCSRSNCANCGGGTNPKMIIPCYYLRKEQVPFPTKFYGPLDCFLEGCPRSGGRGFKTEQDMRMHAKTRHKMEYQAYLEGQATTARAATDHALLAKIAELEQRIAQAEKAPKKT